MIYIRNKGDNCVWFSLLASYHIGDRKTRVSQYEKPDVIAKARHLCLKSDGEFGRRDSFIETPNIEETLNTNTYSLLSGYCNITPS